mgnify:CR=1 FL=1
MATAVADGWQRAAEVSLELRLHEALEQFVSALARRPTPIDPSVLNDRLVNARWSI